MGDFYKLNIFEGPAPDEEKVDVLETRTFIPVGSKQPLKCLGAFSSVGRTGSSLVNSLQACTYKLGNASHL